MMQDPYSQNDGLLGAHAMPPVPKKKTGCLVKFLIGLGVVAIVGIFSVWYAVMHSALPLRVIASMIAGAGAPVHLRIEGVSGSLSSGVGIQKMTWDGGEMAELRVRYSTPNAGEFVLDEVHLGKLHVASAWDDGTEDATLHAIEGEMPGQSPSEKIEEMKQTLSVFRIEKLSLSNLTFKDTASDRVLAIAQITWTGLRAEKGNMDFGDLKVQSNLVDVETRAAEGPYKKQFHAQFKTGPHGHVLKPFEVQVNCGQIDGAPAFTLSAFDSKLTIESVEGKTERYVSNDLNLADYVDAPLPQGLTLEASVEFAGEKASHVRLKGGPFQLGQRTFVIEAIDAPVSQDFGAEPVMLRAVCREGDQVLNYEMAVSDLDAGDAVPTLRSEPFMAPDDVLAWIYYKKPYAELGVEDQGKVARYASWFSMPSEQP